MLKSIHKNRIGIFLMILSSVSVVFGQLFWKLSYVNNIIYLFYGFVLYGVGAIFLILAIRQGKLSVLHPFLSLSYVFSLLVGNFLLNEDISIFRYIGIVIIMIGVVLIGGSDE